MMIGDRRRYPNDASGPNRSFIQRESLNNIVGRRVMDVLSIGFFESVSRGSKSSKEIIAAPIRLLIQALII